MSEMNMKVNRLPVPTWNWLKMNGADVKAPLCTDGALSAETPAGLTEESSVLPMAFPTGMGTDMDRLLRDSGVPVRRWTGASDAPLRIKMEYGADSASANALEIVTERGSDVTVVMDLKAGAEASGFAAVQTRLCPGEDAVLRLIQIQRLDGNMTFCNDVGFRCGNGARAELLQLVLAGGETYMGSACSLEGTNASLAYDLGYLVRERQKLDINYDVLHLGRRTVSEMSASGVLRGQGQKLFRGTIDFQKGASGAVGGEKEDALLMDDTVVNRTIPLILCSEEDVEGNHGATIGRLDDALLFYLESRGLDREEVYEMIARARLMAVCRKITDGPTREEVESWIEKSGGEENDV